MNFILSLIEIDDHWPETNAPMSVKCLNPPTIMKKQRGHNSNQLNLNSKVAGSLPGSEIRLSAIVRMWA